jgi:cyclase
VTFQNANVVHMGDLLFYMRNPRVDRAAGASIKNWIVLLETVAKEHAADTIYIAGHAKTNLPITVARAEVLKFRDYFTALLAYVQKGIASGQSAAVITKVPGVPGFVDYEGSPEGTIQAAYDELTAKV